MTALSRLAGESLFIDPMATLREFERMLSSTQNGRNTGYPPYDIVRVGDDKLKVSFALAGFKKQDIFITVERGHLIVRGEHLVKENENESFLYRGIAMRKFVRSFQLPEFFEVEGANMEDGILNIHLIRKVPEDKKPIEITIK